MDIEKEFENYATKKYGRHTVKTEGMSGILSGLGYQDRKEDYIAGAKMARKKTLEGILPKAEEAFFILKDIPETDYKYDEQINDAHDSIKKTVRFIDTTLETLDE